MSSLPPEITSSLAPDEKILWSGQPRPYVFILRALPAMFFGLVFSILGAFWYHGAILAPWDGWWKLAPTFSFPFIALAGVFSYTQSTSARARGIPGTS
jgi:hypothetical protein